MHTNQNKLTNDSLPVDDMKLLKLSVENGIWLPWLTFATRLCDLMKDTKWENKARCKLCLKLFAISNMGEAANVSQMQAHKSCRLVTASSGSRSTFFDFFFYIKASNNLY